MNKFNENSLDSAAKLFETIKEYMKVKSTKRLHFTEIKKYRHNSEEALMGSIVNFISEKSRLDKNSSESDYEKVLRGFLEDAKGASQHFKVDLECICYDPFPRIREPKGLIAEIQNNPEGILVDEELLKFTFSNIKEIVRDLINERKVIPVRSKKAKEKEDNYEGYYLLPFPSQVKQTFRFIFKTPEESLKIERPKQTRQDKIDRIFGTKTQIFHTDFANTCSENLSKGQDKAGGNKNIQSFQKTYNSWDQINKLSVPNFEKEAEDWFRNRK